MLCVSGTALAGKTTPLQLVTNGDCPTSEAVTAQLGILLPEVSFEPSTDAKRVSIVDLGARYRVTVVGQAREIADDRRSCAERARAAAAFVFLVLHPPELDVAPVSAPAPSRSPRPARFGARFELELAGMVTGAPRTTPDNDLRSGGGGLRAVVRGRYIGGAVGIAGLAPTATSFGAVMVRLWRVPFDLSLRGIFPIGRVDLEADAGLSLTILGAQGLGLYETRSGTRFDPGFRAALAARVWLTSRVGLIVGLESILSFESFPLIVGSEGAVGNTPIFWLSGSAGLVVRIH